MFLEVMDIINLFFDLINFASPSGLVQFYFRNLDVLIRPATPILGDLPNGLADNIFLQVSIEGTTT